MKDMKYLHFVAFPLVLVGALNWGLVALFDYNLVEGLLGTWPMVVKIVYVLVAAAAVYLLVTHKEECKTCSTM